MSNKLCQLRSYRHNITFTFQQNSSPSYQFFFSLLCISGIIHEGQKELECTYYTYLALSFQFWPTTRVGAENKCPNKDLYRKYSTIFVTRCSGRTALRKIILELMWESLEPTIRVKKHTGMTIQRTVQDNSEDCAGQFRGQFRTI